MTIKFANEARGNESRAVIDAVEARSLRTFTPSMAVIERSSGLFHFTNDGRKLADFTSGVLVTNLGHHPKRFLDRLRHYLDLPLSRDEIGDQEIASAETLHGKLLDLEDWKQGVSRFLLQAWKSCNMKPLRRGRRTTRSPSLSNLPANDCWQACSDHHSARTCSRFYGRRQAVEGIQKALWSALKFQPAKDIILATRDGFHGKKVCRKQ